MSDPKSCGPGADWTKLLTDPEFIPHLAMLLQTYRDAPAEERDEKLLAALQKIKSLSPEASRAAGSAAEASKGSVPAQISPKLTPPFEPGVTTSSKGEDRRQHPRMKCFVAVELRVDGSPNPIWGNLSNTSLGGCFVETAASLESGAKLGIGLWVATGKIWIKGLVLNGIVTRTNPSVGARVKFADLDSAGRETLRQFIKYVETNTQTYQAERGYLAQLKR